MADRKIPDSAIGQSRNRRSDLVGIRTQHEELHDGMMASLWEERAKRNLR